MEHADLFQTSHARWLALTRRTPSSHSAFLYGVKSTKIYCRPTCAARLARRANVTFYDTADEARNDGYRPCKRCQPDNGAFISDGEELTSKVIALLRTSDSNEKPLLEGGLKALAEKVSVTPSYLCRVFKKTMGMTIGAYAREFEKHSASSQAGGDEDQVLSYPTGVHDPISLPYQSESYPPDSKTGLLTPATTTRSVHSPEDCDASPDCNGDTEFPKQGKTFDFGHLDFEIDPSLFAELGSNSFDEVDFDHWLQELDSIAP